MIFEMLYSSNERKYQETLTLQKSPDHCEFDLLLKPEKYRNRNKIMLQIGNKDYIFSQGKHQYQAMLSNQSIQVIDKKFQMMDPKDNDEKSECYVR